jgi:hypothetical protein
MHALAAVATAGILALTPASTDSDCTRVGIHVVTDELNAVRVTCPDGTTTVETTSAPQTEAPMQFYPINDTDD